MYANVGANCLIGPGNNTKGGSITVLLTSCLTSLESAVCQLTIFVFICKTDKSKPVKQEVNGTVIIPPLVFPGQTNDVPWGGHQFDSRTNGIRAKSISN